MPKICNHESCSYPVFSGNYCKHHQYLREDKPKSIKKVSEKKSREDKLYETHRRAFLLEKPLCEAKLNECTKIATEIHHTKGRDGNNFLNVPTWLSVCRNCHHWIEMHPKEAKEMGFSQSRLK